MFFDVPHGTEEHSRSTDAGGKHTTEAGIGGAEEATSHVGGRKHSPQRSVCVLAIDGKGGEACGETGA